MDNFIKWTCLTCGESDGSGSSRVVTEQRIAHWAESAGCGNSTIVMEWTSSGLEGATAVHPHSTG